MTLREIPLPPGPPGAPGEPGEEGPPGGALEGYGMPATPLGGALAGQWYHASFGTESANKVLGSSLNPVQGTIYAVPFFCPKDLRLQRVGVDVINTGSSVRIGIYQDDGTGYPSDLMGENVYTTISGINGPLIERDLGPNLYWLALKEDSNSGNFFESWAGTYWPIVPTFVGSGTGHNGACYASGGHPAGALPSTFPLGAVAVYSTPAMYIKIAP